MAQDVAVPEKPIEELKAIVSEMAEVLDANTTEKGKVEMFSHLVAEAQVALRADKKVTATEENLPNGS